MKHRKLKLCLALILAILPSQQALAENWWEHCVTAASSFGRKMWQNKEIWTAIGGLSFYLWRSKNPNYQPLSEKTVAKVDEVAEKGVSLADGIANTVEVHKKDIQLLKNEIAVIKKNAANEPDVATAIQSIKTITAGDTQETDKSNFDLEEIDRQMKRYVDGVAMKAKAAYEESFNRLEKALPGKLAPHIERAVDDAIKKERVSIDQKFSYFESRCNANQLSHLQLKDEFYNKFRVIEKYGLAQLPNLIANQQSHKTMLDALFNNKKNKEKILNPLSPETKKYFGIQDDGQPIRTFKTVGTPTQNTTVESVPATPVSMSAPTSNN